MPTNDVDVHMPPLPGLGILDTGVSLVSPVQERLERMIRGLWRTGRKERHWSIPAQSQKRPKSRYFDGVWRGLHVSAPQAPAGLPVLGEMLGLLHTPRLDARPCAGLRTQPRPDRPDFPLFRFVSPPSWPTLATRQSVAARISEADERQ